MKKIILPLVLVVVTLLFAGCDKTTNEPVFIASADSAQALMAPPTSDQTASEHIGASYSAADARLTSDGAESIALAHAGFTPDMVSHLHSRLDFDNGRCEYDVEFYADGYEYDYEISALTGEIISYDKEKTWNSQNSTADTTVSTGITTTTTAAPSQQITADVAEAIALAHAGYMAGNVFRLHTEYDRDDGRYEYEVEFYADGYEFDYEIDAQTGAILSHHKEWDD